MLRGPVRRRAEREGAERRRRVEVLDLAPGAREIDPARTVAAVQSPDTREDVAGSRRAADIALSRVVHGQRQAVADEIVDHRLRDADEVDRMSPRRELVRMRSDGDVNDRVRAKPRGESPVTPLAAAVLAVADVE